MNQNHSTNVTSLKEYKEACANIPHLENILRILNLTIKGLKYYKAYVSVARVINAIEDEKVILESHYNKYKKIKESR